MNFHLKLFSKSACLCSILFTTGAIEPARAAAPDDPIGAALKHGWDQFTNFLGINNVPTANAIRPTVIPPKGGTKMDSTKFYRVDIRCSVNVDTSKLVNRGVTLNGETFVSHSLWFSSSGSNGNVPPSTAKLVNVFSFLKDAGGTINDTPNDACSETFLLRGSDSVLTVSFSLTDTRTLGFVPDLFYRAVKMAVGFVPLLFAGPLAKPIGDAAKAAGDTEDPMKAIVTAINQSPRKVAVPTRLIASSKPTIIKTAYSNVSIKITEVTDISALISNDNDLRVNFYETIDGIQANFLQGVTTEAAMRGKCGSFANLLTEKYSFNKKDSSFLIGYFAQSAFPADINSRLGCIGNRNNATDIVAYAFIYNKDNGAAQALSKDDIDNYFADNGYPRTPLNKSVAWGYTQKLSNLLSTYAQTDSASNSEIKDALIKWIGSGPIHVDDLTTKIRLNPGDMAPEDLLGKLTSARFQRFGCFIQNPTVGAGAFDVLVLAFPLKAPAGNANNYFDLVDTIGIRMILRGTQKPNPPAEIKQIQITNDTAATLEAANAKGGQCESGIRVNLPSSTRQVASAGQPATSPTH